VRADLALRVAADDFDGHGAPELVGIAEVSAQRVPSETWMLGAQRREACGCEPAPLVSRIGVGLLHPAEPAPAAGLVVDGEHFAALEERCPLAPPRAHG
jgi:hypothetical protein